MKNIERRFTYAIMISSMGVVIVVAAIIVLIGWQLDIAFLKTFGLSAVTMKPNAAVAFLVAGLTLILLQFSASNIKTDLSDFFNLNNTYRNFNCCGIHFSSGFWNRWTILSGF